MVKLTDGVKKIFEEKKDPVACIATVDMEGKPNLGCKGTLGVLDDEHLWYVESYGKKTYGNIQKNPQVAVTIASRDKLEGYQIKGKAELATDGPLYERAVKVMEELSRILGQPLPKPVAGVKIKVEEIYSLTPGPTAGEKIA